MLEDYFEQDDGNLDVWSITKKPMHNGRITNRMGVCMYVFLVPYYTLITNYNCNLEYFLVASNSKNQ